MSHILLFFSVMMLTSTALFQWAAQQGAYENPIARDVCRNAQILCEHPEWAALAAIAATLVCILSQRRRSPSAR